MFQEPIVKLYEGTKLVFYISDTSPKEYDKKDFHTVISCIMLITNCTQKLKIEHN